MSAVIDSGLLENKLIAFIKEILKLGDDVEITPEAKLIDQIGLDSIEAFDAVATMHEIMGVVIPDDFSPKLVATVRDLGNFIVDRYESSAIGKFLEFDLATLETSW